MRTTQKERILLADYLKWLVISIFELSTLYLPHKWKGLPYQRVPIGALGQEYQGLDIQLRCNNEKSHNMANSADEWHGIAIANPFHWMTF